MCWDTFCRNCFIQRMCSTVLCCHAIVFGNSVFANRSGMVASRFLVAAAGCMLLLRFAAESRESHCNGNVRRVNGALGANFSNFGSDDFPFKVLLKKVLQNRRFSALAARSGFGSANRCNLWSRRA